MEQQAPSILLMCLGFLLADFYLIGGVRAGLKIGNLPVPGLLPDYIG